LSSKSTWQPDRAHARTKRNDIAQDYFVNRLDSWCITVSTHRACHISAICLI
jgi:hypothetical protein